MYEKTKLEKKAKLEIIASFMQENSYIEQFYLSAFVTEENEDLGKVIKAKGEANKMVKMTAAERAVLRMILLLLLMIVLLMIVLLLVLLQQNSL